MRSLSGNELSGRWQLSGAKADMPAVPVLAQQVLRSGSRFHGFRTAVRRFRLPTLRYALQKIMTAIW
jgi:hypothetical protein